MNKKEKLYEAIVKRQLAEAKQDLTEEQINEIIGALSGLANVGKNIGKKVTDKAKEIGSKVSDKAKEVGEKVSGKAKEVSDKAKEVYGKVVDSVKQTAANVTSEIKKQSADLEAAYKKGVEEGNKKEAEQLIKIWTAAVEKQKEALTYSIKKLNKYKEQVGEEPIKLTLDTRTSRME